MLSRICLLSLNVFGGPKKMGYRLFLGFITFNGRWWRVATVGEEGRFFSLTFLLTYFS